MVSDLGIVFEFLRVTTHPSVFHIPVSTRDAWSFLNAVFASSGFGMLVETERVMDDAALLIGQR